MQNVQVIYYTWDPSNSTFLCFFVGETPLNSWPFWGVIFLLSLKFKLCIFIKKKTILKCILKSILWSQSTWVVLPSKWKLRHDFFFFSFFKFFRCTSISYQEKKNIKIPHHICYYIDDNGIRGNLVPLRNIIW